MHRLTAIGADTGGDEHEPGKHLRTVLVGLLDKKFSGFLRQVEQDSGRVEKLDATVGERGRFGIRVDRYEGRLKLLAFARVDWHDLVIEPSFF